MFATVAERAAFELTLTVPRRGPWTADAKLTTGDVLAAGPVTLTLAGLTLAGYVYRAGSYSGTTWVRLVGGRGGWGRTVAEKYYRNPFGVSLGPIVTDAANEVGEAVTIVTDSTVGSFYVRENGPACRVLNRSAASWYVGADGVTVVGPRAEIRITSRFDVMESQDFARGAVVIATDFPEQWLPGVIFSSPTITEMQASAVVHRLTASSLRTTVWTG